MQVPKLVVIPDSFSPDVGGARISHICGGAWIIFTKCQPALVSSSSRWCLDVGGAVWILSCWW